MKRKFSYSMKEMNYRLLMMGRPIWKYIGISTLASTLGALSHMGLMGFGALWLLAAAGFCDGAGIYAALTAVCAVAVVLQEETIYIAVAEQDLCYRLISAGGGPGGAEVAAADVHGNGHIFRFCFQYLVEYVDIFASDLIDINAALGIGFAFFGRAELAPGGIIQLEIAAACGIECFYGFLVSCGKII